jgi:outer membrane protein OmpA-like peptidoglycan-associated protein
MIDSSEQMERAVFKSLLIVFLAYVPAALVWANASVPTRDIAAAADSPLLKRYEGAYIVEYASKAYDEFALPLSKLEKVGDDLRDARNNLRFAPKQQRNLEGKLTRLVYVLPEGRSPLEVLRNYQDEIKANAGSVLFDCKTDDCGGDIDSGSDHGGGHTGLLEMIFPREAIKSPDFSNGNCAINSHHADQRFFAATLTGSGSDTQVAVMTYALKDSLYCKALNDRTIAVVVLVESKAREQKMVTVGASEMARAIDENGRVALYGILFDFDKADIKPESNAQLEQISALLKADANLKLQVVGHTDNQGGAAYNLDLSRRRADAVVNALATRYGVIATRLLAQGMGSTAPVASNDSDAGRAKNRRVELVKQ